MKNYSQLISDLLNIAKEAGESILRIYLHYDDFEVEKKNDNSPVTLADKASNEVICEALSRLSPDIPVISEENILPSYEVRKKWKYCWLVDPLDGTKEFIKGNGEFCSCIALIESGRPVLGLIHSPVKRESWWAATGQGAWWVRSGFQQVMQVQSFRMTDEYLNILCSRSHNNAATQQFIEQFSEPNLISMGSAMKFMLIANGDAHFYPKIGHTSEWDTAAAQIILEEAGGELLHFGTLQPLVYNKENLLNPAFLARGKVVGE